MIQQREPKRDPWKTAGVEERVGVLGAGAIGCYIGGRLTRAGIDTRLVGRDSMAREVQKHGLRISESEGEGFSIPPDEVAYTTRESDLHEATIVLVTLKSADTRSAARSLLKHLAPRTVLVSFQNGVSNGAILREELARLFTSDSSLESESGSQARALQAKAILDAHPEAPIVLDGMVPYNVARMGDGGFHRGTTGNLYIQHDDRGGASLRVQQMLFRSGLACEEHDDLLPVLRGKLLINLNNSVNALSDRPLRAQLGDRGYRKITAALMREGLAVYRRADLPVGRAGKMLPKLAPFILSLPDWLFFRAAAPMVKIDPEARSSMWEDLRRGRKTEIDFLNGEIVRAAEERGFDAPLNRKMQILIHEAEAAGKSPGYSAEELLQRLGMRP